MVLLLWSSNGPSGSVPETTLLDQNNTAQDKKSVGGSSGNRSSSSSFFQNNRKTFVDGGSTLQTQPQQPQPQPQEEFSFAYRSKVFYRITTSTTRNNLSSFLEACIRHHLWQGELAVRRRGHDRHKQQQQQQQQQQQPGGALIIPKQQPQKKKKKKTTIHYSSKPPSHMPSSPSHHIIQHREEEEDVFWDAPQEQQEVDDVIQNPTTVPNPWNKWCRMEWTTHGIGLVSLVGYFIVTNALQSLLDRLLLTTTTTTTTTASQEQSSSWTTACMAADDDDVLVRGFSGFQQVAFVIAGALLLRGMTTSLFWFSSPRVYDCVKFHLHNQQQQQQLEQPWSHCSLLYLLHRRLPQVELVLFLLGYALLEGPLNAWNEVLFEHVFGVTDDTAVILCYDVVTTGLALYALCCRHEGGGGGGGGGGFYLH